MYSRARLSRTLRLVLALSLTAPATGVFAWKFHAGGEGDPALPAPGRVGQIRAETLDVDRTQIPGGPEMSGIYREAQGEPAATDWPERIRMVE